MILPPRDPHALCEAILAKFKARYMATVKGEFVHVFDRKDLTLFWDAHAKRWCYHYLRNTVHLGGGDLVKLHDVRIILG